MLEINKLGSDVYIGAQLKVLKQCLLSILEIEVSFSVADFAEVALDTTFQFLF
jgi:hypothetical protein